MREPPAEQLPAEWQLRPGIGYRVWAYLLSDAASGMPVWGECPGAVSDAQAAAADLGGCAGSDPPAGRIEAVFARDQGPTGCPPGWIGRAADDQCLHPRYRRG